MAVEFYCDYCGDVIEGDRASIEVGGAGSVRGLRASFYHYCAGSKGDRFGSCFEHANACLGEMKEWAHREEGSGLVWHLRKLPRAMLAPDPKMRSTAPVQGSLPLDEANLHPRSALALRRAGVRTLEEAAERSEVELLAIEGVARQTADRLFEALQARELSFRPGPSPEVLGTRIRNLRGDAGLTRREVANAIRTDGDDELYENEVAAWEAGRRVPTPKRLERLAAAFGVPAEQLTEAGAV